MTVLVSAECYGFLVWLSPEASFSEFFVQTSCHRLQVYNINLHQHQLVTAKKFRKRCLRWELNQKAIAFSRNQNSHYCSAITPLTTGNWKVLYNHFGMIGCFCNNFTLVWQRRNHKLWVHQWQVWVCLSVQTYENQKIKFACGRLGEYIETKIAMGAHV